MLTPNPKSIFLTPPQQYNTHITHWLSAHLLIHHASHTIYPQSLFNIIHIIGQLPKLFIRTIVLLCFRMVVLLIVLEWSFHKLFRMVVLFRSVAHWHNTPQHLSNYPQINLKGIFKPSNRLSIYSEPLPLKVFVIRLELFSLC